MKGTLKHAAEKLQRKQVLPVNVAILDGLGTIVSVNSAWKAFGRRNGLRLPKSGVGLNYLNYSGSESPNSPQFVKDLKNLLAGRLDLLALVYPCHSPTKKRWFFLSGVPLSLEPPAGVALLHTNLTPLLPPPAKGRHTPHRTDVELAIKMDVLGAAVERSVSRQLASQFTPLLGSHRSSPIRERGGAKADANLAIASAQLSPAQLQVLGLLARGKTNAEIAKILFRSPNTIKLHVSAILKQLNYKNRTQAALLASELLRGGEGSAA